MVDSKDMKTRGRVLIKKRVVRVGGDRTEYRVLGLVKIQRMMTGQEFSMLITS